MPILIRCEHCPGEGKYAVYSDYSSDAVTIKPKVVITLDGRHVCHNVECLVKELESQSRSFDYKFSFSKRPS